MKSIKTEIVINAPKERVWGVLTDFEAYPNWNPFIVSIKGKLAVGNRVENTLLSGQKKMVFKPVVLSVVPGKYFDWLGSLFVKGIFDGHHYFEIEELAPGQVKLTQGENFTGLFSSMIINKIGDDTRHNFTSMNEAIKKLAEQKGK